MFFIIIPLFMVILIGYGYGRLKPESRQADKLINDYVLYIALPALLFIAVAQAEVRDLKRWTFILPVLAGVCTTYILGILIARGNRVKFPQSSLIGMGACYGTTGYMGVPLLISVYGEQAMLPAAIATVLHNIPAIMAVIISWDLYSQRQGKTAISFMHSARGAAVTIIKNPLTIAVVSGGVFASGNIEVPVFLAAFARFLGNAAGPTALFALGLGLSRLDLRKPLQFPGLKLVFPLVVLKLIIQPLITFIVAVYLVPGAQEQQIWLAGALVMAAQPIGAGVFVFAKKDNYSQDVIALSIMISLLLSMVTMPLLLRWLAG